MDIRDILKIMVERNASDIYLTVDVPPMYRIEGVVQPIGSQKLTPQDLENLAASIMNERQKKDFADQLEMNLALSLAGLSRFRVNIFRQRSSVGLVIRKINVDIATIDELGLPPILKDIIMLKRGLILVVGATGSGKSTTLAAMIDHRNSLAPGHIITVEDPIEFVHRHKRSIVNQREVGFDTHSFHDALKSAMRQAPDVILIGEIRDAETMKAAITFADTGHLCLATLHSTNANQSFERIINFFPESQHAQIFLQLSLNLKAIISQRLVLGADGKRVAAMEIMLDTPRIKELIKHGEVDAIKEAMVQSSQEGCQTFDMALYDLYTAGKIDLDQALINADSMNNLRLKIKVDSTKDAGVGMKSPANGLRLEGPQPQRRLGKL
ncbi:MAG TPA: PilT/PilU family type 4a pilus ATPase [Methylomirabilota bacterium]|jgi:twitching motility protein PilU|nr:PilT/PilU family type 4a pilus ATPase [Methylomirabilota bacterium]